MIYLVNKETNEIIEKFKNVTEWSENYILIIRPKSTVKYYASEGEYFTDQAPEIKED